MNRWPIKMNQIINRKHCLPTKTNTRRADAWNSEAVFFQPGKRWLRQNLLRVLYMSWYLCTLYFPKRQSLIIAACNLAIWRFFFHLIVYDTLKHQQQCFWYSQRLEIRLFSIKKSGLPFSQAFLKVYLLEKINKPTVVTRKLNNYNRRLFFQRDDQS